ncbi:Bug family tripartite tricarboxylate transporter substrate binding protein [Humitalea sp. 24SJ18S-53]|uniref:Bug family tripartite tricarboxylate transporter substrate binding protein n=1 Tax=Humitalea sp. 24SJ18S-53 TaxID=3422307 RepID=UPI003D66B750
MITRRLALAAAAVAAASPAMAQAYPDQPIRLIIPFAPGGPADLIARLIGARMGEKLGRPMVVESRSGAGGTIGVDAAAKARPDGYTLVLASTGAMAILPHMMPSMPYDPLRDLTPIGLVLAVPQVLAIAPGLPVNNVAELVALAKARPGTLAYGSAGTGSSLHLAGELFRLRAGIDITHVPYRGAAPAVTDLLAGRIQMLLADVPILLPQVRGGTLRALAVTGRERSDVLPDLPTMAEAGVAGVVSETWYGLLGPAGIPADRVAILQTALAATLREPATREALAAQGGRIADMDAAGFAAFIRADHTQWGEIVRTAGIRME